MRLHRRGLTVRAARELGIADADVDDAYRALAVPSDDDLQAEVAERANARRPSRDELEAARDRMPKRIAEPSAKRDWPR